MHTWLLLLALILTSLLEPVFAQGTWGGGLGTGELTRPMPTWDLPIKQPPKVDPKCLLMDPPPASCTGQWRALQKHQWGSSIFRSPGENNGFGLDRGCATKADVVAALAELKASIESQTKAGNTTGLKPDPRRMSKGSNSDPMETKNNPFAVGSIKTINKLLKEQEKALKEEEEARKKPPEPMKK